jgi:hypothetical protein
MRQLAQHHGYPFLLTLALLVAWKTLPTQAEDEQGVPATGSWLVRPEQTEPKILQWKRQHPELVSLETHDTLGGHTAYAITVTDPQVAAKGKKRLLFSQPHAHEPAATAGMMDFLAQLLDGKHPDGEPTDLDRAAILRRTVLTFIPDGNPDGRARAPEDWWDGRKHSNDEFLDLAFGRTDEGRRFPRQGRWSTKDQQPALLGFVYERINAHEYVEPNRDRESTFFRLVSRSLSEPGCDLHVDLHQTEFANSQYNSMVILPFSQKDLPEKIQEANRQAAEAIIDAWGKMGARPIPEAKPLGYGEDQLRYFRKCWGEIYSSVPHVIVEIQNNNVRTSPVVQRQLIETSVRAAVESVMRRDD